MHLTRRDFERLVEEALETLPPQFVALIENIAITVEEEPTDDDLDHLEPESDDDELLGIYRGTPLTERVHDMSPRLPDTIAIFRGPILRVCETRRDAVEEIRETVIHELGHYFGLSDDEMEY
ncbi:MAG TPA: metallopeptidase family protein [Thermoanaerobaculia bacterium]|nr:metallopeptidase family protein [Thermoanaerobaculia bacterium]